MDAFDVSRAYWERVNGHSDPAPPRVAWSVKDGAAPRLKRVGHSYAMPTMIDCSPGACAYHTFRAVWLRAVRLCAALALWVASAYEWLTATTHYA